MKIEKMLKIIEGEKTYQFKNPTGRIFPQESKSMNKELFKLIFIGEKSDIKGLIKQKKTVDSIM